MPPTPPAVVEDALRPMAAGYRELFDRLHAVVEPDQRIRAFWLSGSLAKGSADAGSDLDVLLAVRDEDFPAFAAGWRSWLDTVADLVMARELPFAAGCITALTADCLRLDVISEPAEDVRSSGHRQRLLVFDRDGLDAIVPEPAPAPDPDPNRVAELVEEAYRRIAIFPQAVVGRRDWLLGVAGVQGQRDLLYELFVEVNRPLPPTGVKQYAAKLTAEQREVLGSLPAVVPKPDSLLTGMRATVTAWNREGRAAVEAIGVPWPERLTEAVTRYFDRHC